MDSAIVREHTVDAEFADTLFEMIDPLIGAALGLKVRPSCFGSIVMSLAATHKLLIVLSSIEVEVDETAMNTKKSEWMKLLDELRRAKKWSSLDSTVPGSFLQLYLTQVELSIMAIPNQQEVLDVFKVATSFGVGIIKSIVTMVS